jgi:murein DD-endopeptidase MepM/ murein hydrolase activator NlpD
MPPWRRALYRPLPLIFALFALALSACAGSPSSSAAVAASQTPPQPAIPTAAQLPAPARPAPSATTAASATPLPAPSATTAASATPLPTPTSAPPPPPPAFGYPIGAPGRPPGDGFFVRHGEAVENTWFNPGWWHAGEDWYAIEGDTAGAAVLAAAAGEVVYVGANYPGRVVIVRHADDLFSMYGHLDPAVAVAEGQPVARGETLGSVLARGDDVPNHLHFELRTFFTAREVNGDAPRYGYRCGVNCPPGPGYWPIDAPDHPSEMGWRNPTHLINSRMFPAGAQGSLGEVVVASQPISPTAQLWSGPPGDSQATPQGELALVPGARLALLAIWAGPEDSRETSALGYQLWYQLGLPDGGVAWAQAAIPSSFETGGDGRPSSVYFTFLPPH